MKEWVIFEILYVAIVQYKLQKETGRSVKERLKGHLYAAKTGHKMTVIDSSSWHTQQQLHWPLARVQTNNSSIPWGGGPWKSSTLDNSNTYLIQPWLWMITNPVHHPNKFHVDAAPSLLWVISTSIPYPLCFMHQHMYNLSIPLPCPLVVRHEHNCVF